MHRPGAAESERGSGTVAALAAAAAGLALCGTVVGFGHAAVVDARTAGAADLAALAAADALRAPALQIPAPRIPAPTEACALAAEVAARHGASLSACAVETGGSVRVELTGVRAWGAAVTARSRAGPSAGPAQGPPGGSGGAGP